MKRLFIVERVIDALRQSAEAARPLETGGVLVGVLNGADPWITSFVEVIDEGRTSASFAVPYGVTPLAVEAAQAQDGRVGYLGLWHSHPANMPASPKDKATLRRDAVRSGRPKDIPAILIVVRDTAESWVIDAMRDSGLGPAPLEIVMTGPLRVKEVVDAR